MRGGIFGFMLSSPEVRILLLMIQVSYIWGSNRVGQDESDLLLFDHFAHLWPEIRAVKVALILGLMPMLYSSQQLTPIVEKKNS